MLRVKRSSCYGVKKNTMFPFFAEGMHLPAPYTQAQLTHILSLKPSNHALFMHANDVATEGTWEYDPGKPPSVHSY